jgi:transposase InsO family protein
MLYLPGCDSGYFFPKSHWLRISRNLDTKLTLAALRIAIEDLKPLRGSIHHSDRGTQYASADFVKKLEFYGSQISMSHKGSPYDNALAESFTKTLKSEEVNLWEYRILENVLRRIPYFIDDVYNQKRLHSAIGYRPLCEFELMLKSIPKPDQNTMITLL